MAKGPASTEQSTTVPLHGGEELARIKRELQDWWPGEEGLGQSAGATCADATCNRCNVGPGGPMGPA